MRLTIGNLFTTGNGRGRETRYKHPCTKLPGNEPAISAHSCCDAAGYRDDRRSVARWPLPVAPADAGAHNHREQLLSKSSDALRDNNRRSVRFPAFAGTTEEEHLKHLTPPFCDAAPVRRW